MATPAAPFKMIISKELARKKASILAERKLQSDGVEPSTVSLERKESLGERAFEALEAFTTIPFFENMDMKELRSFTRSFTRHVYAPGSVIMEEGKCAQQFHVIVSGKVQLNVRGSDGSKAVLATKSNGEFFGEAALVSNEYVAPLTALAIDKTIILSITAEHFTKFVQQHPKLHVTVEHRALSIHVHLRLIPLFASIPELKLQQLASMFEIKRCPEGQVICRQGDSASGFYVIESGRINVSANDQNGGVHLNTLTKGDWFGEIALIQNVRRTATLTSIQPCVMLYLSKRNFELFLKLCPEVQAEGSVFAKTIQRRTANSLKCIPLFASLQRKRVGPMVLYDDTRLAKLGEMFTFVQYEAGARVFAEGDRADAFYIIVYGTVVISSRKPGDDKKVNPEQVLLDTLGDNDWFGEIALIHRTHRTASVTATSHCVMMRLDHRYFERLMEIVPDLRRTLGSVMSIRTAQTLRNIPFFKKVKENKPWSKIGILGSMFEFEHFLDGQTVCKEGDVADKFYVIADGSVEVTKSVWNATKCAEEKIVLDVMKRDGWFGEIALLKSTQRLSTVTCLEDTLLLSVTQDKFKKFLTLAPDLLTFFTSLITHRVANLLRQIDFFQHHIHENKPWNKLDLLSSMFVHESLPSEEIVFEQHESPDNDQKFYVVAVGSVEVRVEATHEHKAFTKMVTRGGYFGEFSLLKNCPRTATVITREPCVVFSLTKPSFKQFLKIAPEIRVAFERSMMEYQGVPSWLVDKPDDLLSPVAPPRPRAIMTDTISASSSLTSPNPVSPDTFYLLPGQIPEEQEVNILQTPTPSARKSTLQPIAASIQHPHALQPTQPSSQPSSLASSLHSSPRHTTTVSKMARSGSVQLDPSRLGKRRESLRVTDGTLTGLSPPRQALARAVADHNNTVQEMEEGRVQSFTFMRHQRRLTTVTPLAEILAQAKLKKRQSWTEGFDAETKVQSEPAATSSIELS